MARDPTISNFEDNLLEIAREAIVTLGRRANEITNDAASKGALGNSRLRIVYADALEEAWREAVKKMIGRASLYKLRGLAIEELSASLKSRFDELFPEMVTASRALAEPSGFRSTVSAEMRRRVDEILSFANSRLGDFEKGVSHTLLSKSLSVGGARQAGSALPSNGTAAAPSSEPLTISGGGTTIDAQEELSGHSAAIHSSTWTGRRSLDEQVAAVRACAPIAVDALDDLIRAIEERRFNDEATHSALERLKELRDALAELIGKAESRQPMLPAWHKIERLKGQIVTSVKAGARIVVAQPILAYGVACVIGQLTGEPITSGLVAAVYGADALREGLAGKSDKER